MTKNKTMISDHNLEILNSFLHIISRTISLTTIKLYLWKDLTQTKIPIDFGRGQKVGAAYGA